MQHFFVSKTLAEAMAVHFVPHGSKPDMAMSWYAHWVPVLDGSCTLVMEARTRYCMVFHNLTPEDYENFVVLFRKRLWREVAAVCQARGTVRQRLSDSVKRHSAQFEFSLGLDYSISGDVYDAARHLQNLVDDLGGFPMVGITEFGLGIKLNQEVLRQKDEEQSQAPLAAFRQLWLDQLILDRG